MGKRSAGRKTVLVKYGWKHKSLAPTGKKDSIRPIKNQSSLGRNDPCYCGSGKKYKKCCMTRDG